MTMVKTAFVIFVLAGSASALRNDVNRVAEEMAEASKMEPEGGGVEEVENLQMMSMMSGSVEATGVSKQSGKMSQELASGIQSRQGAEGIEASNVQRVAEEVPESKTDLKLQCRSLKKVDSCGQSAAATAESCKQQCRSHGISKLDFSHYRCVWSEAGVCQHGAKLPEVPTKCVDSCGAQTWKSADLEAQKTAKELEGQATEARDFVKVLQRELAALEKQVNEDAVNPVNIPNKLPFRFLHLPAEVLVLVTLTPKKLQDHYHAALASAVTQATEALEAGKGAISALEDAMHATGNFLQSAKTQDDEAKMQAMQKAFFSAKESQDQANGARQSFLVARQIFLGLNYDFGVARQALQARVKQ